MAAWRYESLRLPLNHTGQGFCSDVTAADFGAISATEPSCAAPIFK